MNPSDFWWGSPYQEQYESLGYPVVLAGSDLTFLWANRAAVEMNLPALFPAAARSHLFLHPDSTFFEFFLQNQPFNLHSEELSASGLCFLLTPAWDQGSVAGMIVTLTPSSIIEPESPPPSGAADEPSLEEVERMIAAISHQTHDPTFGILSSLSIISRRNDTEMGDPDIHECVVHIVRRCYQMLHSNNNMCEFIKYRNNIKEFLPKTMDLCLFLDQLCRLISVMLENEGYQCQYIIPSKPIVVQFDPDKLANILFNLVSNAAKALGDHGRISMEMQLKEDTALISVTDSGLGMPAHVLAQAFEPFFSVDPHTGGLWGDGLGLTICQHAARMHGGAIALDSQEGKGTRAVLSLPLREGDFSQVTLGDVTGGYMYNRYSDLYITLSDVCDVYRMFGRNEGAMDHFSSRPLTGWAAHDPSQD